MYFILRFNTTEAYWTNLGSYGNGGSGLACNDSLIYFYTNNILAYFDLYSNAFTNVSTGPEISKPCIGIIGDSVYIMESDYSLELLTIYNFNTNSNIWDSDTLDFSFHSFACSFNFESIYFFGGYKNSSLSNELLKFTPSNLNLEILSSSFNYPDPRSYGTLNSLLGYYYLIGGSNKGEFFSDVWKSNVDVLDWIKIDYLGDFIGLSHHCTCIYASSLMIYGGLTASGLSSKLFQYSNDNKITEILVSGIKPSARMGSCIVANASDIIIFGGETQTGYSGELWKFEIGILNYTLIDTYIYGIAYHNCELSGTILKIVNGKMNNGEYNEYVIEKDLIESNSTWESLGPFSNPASSAIATLFGPVLTKFGGEFYNKIVEIGEIFHLTTNETNFTMDYKFGLVGAAFSVFNKSIFIFGGKGSKNSLEFVNSGYWNYKLKLGELYCNEGMRREGEICIGCTKGTYSDKIDSIECKKCPKGTYNHNTNSRSLLFCTPCPFGTFGDKEGLSDCYACPSFSYCPVGASEPKINYTHSSITSINPFLSTNTSKLNSFIFNLEMICISIGVLMIILFLSNKKLRTLAKKIDIFKQNHNNTLNSPMILKKTEIGGCCTILFILASICLSAITLLYFFLENESVSQALVPLASIINDYPNISGDLSFNLTLINFGGICPEPEACEKILSIKGITYESYSVTCENVNGNCRIIYYCRECILGDFPSLKMYIQESRCFASSIDLNVTSNSGINDKISSVLVKVKPSQDSQVLIGLTESNVNIDVIYSVFENTNTIKTGYYVLSNTAPEVGSSHESSDVPLYNTLLLNIILNKQNSALLTLISVKVATELIFTGLLGGITGILEIFSFLMDATESSYENVTQKIRSKIKVNKVSEKTDRIRNNFDWKSVLATKKSLWIADSASITGTQQLNLDEF